jgi:4'-phosphopantetheinyl transferase
VWRADLDTVTDELCDLLCEEERARSERFLGERDRKLWTCSRAVLRELLGRYLHEDPRTLRFSVGAHGKPALTGDAAGSPTARDPASATPARICFNLSHSGELTLLAFSPRAAVGVDIELASRPIDALAIAARVFGPTEARRLEGLDEETRQREFLRAWVLHEAELKCLGTGIGGAHTGGRQAGAGIGARRPWTTQLEVGPRAAAALAVESTPRELRCWDWRS